jgi:hypothetical protein
VPQIGDGGEQHLGARQHQLTERGGPCAAVVALEQRPAERPLDAVELRGQRRLGEPELRGGPGDAALLGDRADHPQVPQLKVHGGEGMSRRAVRRDRRVSGRRRLD